jgi:hypothetical protein
MTTDERPANLIFWLRDGLCGGCHPAVPNKCLNVSPSIPSARDAFFTKWQLGYVKSRRSPAAAPETGQ